MRLIDADALWEKVGKIEIPSNHTMIAYKLKTAFDEAPTIDAEWIPVKWRELNDEEREYYGDDYTCMADCKLPDDGDEILISRNNGLWVSLVEFCNDDFVTDSDGNDWVNDVDAWMPLPKGYIKQSEKIVENLRGLNMCDGCIYLTEFCKKDNQTFYKCDNRECVNYSLPVPFGAEIICDYKKLTIKEDFV